MEIVPPTITTTLFRSILQQVSHVVEDSVSARSSPPEARGEVNSVLWLAAAHAQRNNLGPSSRVHEHTKHREIRSLLRDDKAFQATRSAEPATDELCGGDAKGGSIQLSYKRRHPVSSG